MTFKIYKQSKVIRWIYWNSYRILFPNMVHYLRKELSDCDHVLDLGCGFKSPIRYCKVRYSIGVEIFGPYLKESKNNKIHNEYIQEDVREIIFEAESFDAVIALDVLEHLPKKDGYELIEKMEKWARKKIIIFIPNGFIQQNKYDGNSFQVHQSGWQVEDFQKLGFKVFGMSGLKKLRGKDKAEVNFKPVILWEMISELTQKIVYFYPKSAFHLFAIKEFEK